MKREARKVQEKQYAGKRKEFTKLNICSTKVPLEFRNLEKSS